ncbi:hypothetical protein FXO37_22230 [Capsicum annuum]|nr:hypothetical protein FXO37_22230 [Capsicum annuum]
MNGDSLPASPGCVDRWTPQVCCLEGQPQGPALACKRNAQGTYRAWEPYGQRKVGWTSVGRRKRLEAKARDKYVRSHPPGAHMDEIHGLKERHQRGQASEASFPQAQDRAKDLGNEEGLPIVGGIMGAARAKLCAVDTLKNEPVTVAEMEQIQTQEREDGTELVDVFASFMGLEHPGFVRLYGRGVTKTSLKDNLGNPASSLDEMLGQNMEEIEERMKQRMLEKFEEQKGTMQQQIAINIIERLQRLNPDIQLNPDLLAFCIWGPTYNPSWKGANTLPWVLTLALTESTTSRDMTDTILNVVGGAMWWNHIAMRNATWKFTATRWDHIGTLEKDNSKLRAWRDAPISLNNTEIYQVPFGWPLRRADMYLGALLYKNDSNSSPENQIWVNFISLES